MRNYLRQATAEMRRLEDVFEDAFDVDPRPFIRINAECAKAKVQRANVIETEDVISVTMRDQDRVEMTQAKPQCLLSEIG